MHLAVISTTIRGERGYVPYDGLAKKAKFATVSFIIAGDKKSPPFDASRFRCAAEYLDVKSQGRYECSEAIGWNKFARRNIALLRAFELKPDFILTIDDDNIPGEDYFDLWYAVLTEPAKKIVVPLEDAPTAHWHNYLKTSDADIEIYPRGFPIPFRHAHSTAVREADTPIPIEQIGVFQGISLGDPDIDAQTRIVYPKPLPVTSVSERNYCLKHVWSPYNTQNTMLSRKVFPLAFTWPHAGRFEDIYASFVWQRFLFNNEMYAHIGDGVNQQERGKRDDLRDLNLEVEGYLRSHEVWEEINKISEKDPVAFIGKLMQSNHDIIGREKDFMRAYLKDLEKVL